MKTTLRIFSMLLVLVIGLTACTPVALPTQTPATATIDIAPIYTSAAATIAVEGTRNAALMATATPLPEPTLTEAPTEMPAVELPTAMPVEAVMQPSPTMWIPVSGDTLPVIRARLSTNCRQGPDPKFDVVAAFEEGEKSRVVGKLRGGGWWYIENPQDDDPKYCWVWGETTEVEGNINYVQEMFVATPYVSKPIVNLSLSVDPETSNTCPQTFTITATLKTDRLGDFTYSIVDETGAILKSGILSFLDDGTKTITITKSYSKDITKWVQMKVSNPVTERTGKIKFTLDCP